MNVLPLAQSTHMMDQKMMDQKSNSVVYVKVVREPMKFVTF